MYICNNSFRSVGGRYYYYDNEIDYAEYSRLTFLERENFKKKQDSLLDIITEAFSFNTIADVPSEFTPSPEPETEFRGGSFGGGGASADWNTPDSPSDNSNDSTDSSSDSGEDSGGGD